MGWDSYEYEWPQYVTVAERRRRAAKKVEHLKKTGQKLDPVQIAGTKIASTFWGNAWCKNLEAYSDYSNRLPRGRSYVRSGAVIDLQMAAGKIEAQVVGTHLYKVEIKIKPLDKKRWAEIKRRCEGSIHSLIELLKGSISKNVMEIVSQKGEGLFPSPSEISLSCSCPDSASMCKHVAAVLYGVGARLDRSPKLLFLLRGVDPMEMVQSAVEKPRAETASQKRPAIKSDDLSSLFGVEIDLGEASATEKTPAAKKPSAAKKPAVKKPEEKEPPAKKPATKKPVAKRPAAKKPVAKRPAAKKPVAKKPAVKKPAKIAKKG